MKNTPLGIIPAGSGNGIAKNISLVSKEEYLPENFAYIIAKGQTKYFDLMEIESASRSDKIYSFLSIAWAFISKCDLESEKIRFIGSARFTIWGVYYLLFQKNYFGTFSYANEEKIDQDFKYPSLRSELDSKYFTTESKNFAYFYSSLLEYPSYNLRVFPKALPDDGMSDVIVLFFFILII
jgi:sphingosine kinase